MATMAMALLLVGTATATTSQTKSTKSTKSSSSSHKSSKPSTSANTSSSKPKKKSAKATSHGQHTTDKDRTLEIQQALVREHSLTGESTGKWDQDTKDALFRMQAEN